MLARFGTKVEPGVPDIDALLPPLNETAKPPPKMSIMSFRGGMQALPDSLRTNLSEAENVTLRSNTSVTSIHCIDDGFQVTIA